MVSIIKVTGRCDLRCSYCYVGDKSKNFNLPISHYKKFIDKLYIELKKRNNTRCQIIFHGGEPLIVGKEYIKEAITYAKSVISDIDLEFSMQSNGYSIDEEWIELFKEFDVRVGISLDGTKRFHDKCRITAKNSPTFDKIINNILKLKKEGLSDSVLMVYNDDFYGNEKEILDFLIKHSLNCKINPLIKCGDAKSEQKTYSKFLINLFKEYIKSETTINIRPISTILNAILYNNTIRECTFSNSCIKNFICLNYDGNIYPCGRFSNLKSFCYGNIDKVDNVIDYEKRDFLVSRKVDNKIEECNSCKYKKLCTGGCTMTALVDSSDVYSKTCFCAEYKELFEFMHKEGLILLKEFLLNKKAELKDILGGDNFEL